GGGGDARRVRAVLERVAREVVLPGMLSARASARRAEAGAVAQREAEGAAAGLASRALSGAEGAAGRVFALCAGALPGTARLALLEGAARALGDLWAEDACGEAEVAIALCRLQSGLPAAGASWQPAAPSRRGAAA
ncbi:hypothetical protein, partial [Craurococcus roseus]|uniref:hypothetical protein n=1 Tax=Craurococcus roseus TaxID=77585 RepID=UPI0031D46075